MTLALYDAPRSNNCRKVRLVAAELGVALDLHRLDFAKGEAQSAEYRAKNPNGKIPTLIDGDFVLWESAAILYYLAARHPEGGLVPSDPRARATLDQWMFWWTAHAEEAFASLNFERRVKQWLGLGTPEPTLIAAAERQLRRFLPILDRQLDGKQHVLHALSLVDFYMAPTLEMAAGLEVDLAPYPHIVAWLARLTARPYWATA
ncbi:MAG: glutathione S-transferase family protein [Myxococcota bacterium]